MLRGGVAFAAWVIAFANGGGGGSGGGGGHLVFPVAAAAAVEGDSTCTERDVGCVSQTPDEFVGAVEFDMDNDVLEAAAPTDGAEPSSSSSSSSEDPTAESRRSEYESESAAFGLPMRTGGGSRVVFWVILVAFGVLALVAVIWFIHRGKRKRPAPLADPNGQTVDLTACFRRDSTCSGSATVGDQNGADAAGNANQETGGKADRPCGIVFPSKPFLAAVAARAANRQVKGLFARAVVLFVISTVEVWLSELARHGVTAN